MEGSWGCSWEGRKKAVPLEQVQAPSHRSAQGRRRRRAGAADAGGAALAQAAVAAAAQGI